MQPTKERNHSGIHLQYKSENFLFDCGEGIQRQMRIAGLKISKINKIFISHWHGDHAIGIIGLMSSMGADQSQQVLKIYGPEGSLNRFNLLKKAFPSMNTIKHKLIEVTEEGVLLSEKDYIIESYKLKHGMECVGFSFREKDALKVDMKKVKKFGLKEGPIICEFANGNNVKHNGKMIKAKDVTYKVVGKKIAYVADTRPCFGARKLAKESDLLIIESTFLEEDKKYAIKYDHMTAKESAELARKAECKQVILTHPSLRYKNTSVLTKEAKKYHKKVKFAKDFMVVEV